MTEENSIEMYVGGLVLDPNTQAPIVVLKDETGKICLPIWIGIAEATSIASAIKQVTMARPLTHDLMFDIFMEVGVKLQRVVITDLRDSTYYAELALAIGDKVILVDARPSDAIALALRTSSPICVAQRVLDQAKISFANEPGVQAGGENNEPIAEKEAPPAPPSEGTGEKELIASATEAPMADEKDFKTIDKGKWAEILQSLGPDDFKYKM